MTENKSLVATSNRPIAIVPQSFGEIKELAAAIARSGMAPKGYLKNPPREQDGYSEEKIAIGILHGLEVGFTPMAALQSIAVVNGMPTIFGDGAMAKLLESGLLEDKREFFEDGPEIEREGEQRGSTVKIANPVAVCILKRKGIATPFEGRFSLADAFRAGLMGKDPYQKYQKRMIMWRAKSWAMRDGFADVLRGLHIREEVEDMAETAPTPPAPPRPSRTKKVDVPAGAVDAEIVSEETADQEASEPERAPTATSDEDPPFDADEFITGFLSQLDRCKNAEEVTELKDFNEEELGQIPAARQADVFAAIEARAALVAKPPATTEPPAATQPPPTAAPAVQPDAQAPTASRKTTKPAAPAVSPGVAVAATDEDISHPWYDNNAGYTGCARALIGVLGEAKTGAELDALLAVPERAKNRAWLEEKAPQLYMQVEAFITKQRGLMAAPPVMP